MKLTFDTDIMQEVSKVADGLFLSAEAADQLADFEKLYKDLTEFRSNLLREIAEKAISVDPIFTSISSDKVKLVYAAHGTKYIIDQSMIEEIPEQFYSVEIKYKANTKEIEKEGTLPMGIIAPERTKSLTIRLIEGKL
jgi:hypothetical protein